MPKETDLVPLKITKPGIPDKWDFTAADTAFDKQIHNWRRLSGDVISTLWIFYNKLPRIEGRPKKTPQNCGVLPRWIDWLQTKGISENTPINHFKALGWLDDRPHVAHNSGDSEWNTPKEYIEAARRIMSSIDVDPASNDIANEIVKAKTFYTVSNSGLDKDWAGNVWMNPPYSQPLVSNFCDTFIKKLSSGEISQGCVLINNVTETEIGQNLISACSAVCFPAGRIKFLDENNEATGCPLQGQMILYFGKCNKSFVRQFRRFGVCLLKLSLVF